MNYLNHKTLGSISNLGLNRYHFSFIINKPSLQNTMRLHFENSFFLGEEGFYESNSHSHCEWMLVTFKKKVKFCKQILFFPTHANNLVTFFSFRTLLQSKTWYLLFNVHLPDHQISISDFLYAPARLLHIKAHLLFLRLENYRVAFDFNFNGLTGNCSCRLNF